jgi:D-sedoheptulose 7-phosphate isomerase
MSYFDELQQVLSRLQPAPLLDFVRSCQGTLWLAGNGGSASIAQHWACDLSKAAGRRVQALGSNPAVLTAWSNDHNYDGALVAELLRIVQPLDQLLCLSCSGTSPNIQRLIEYAGGMDIPSALITSTLCSMTEADLTIHIPHTNYGIIEDSFSAIGHWLTEELQK